MAERENGKHDGGSIPGTVEGEAGKKRVPVWDLPTRLLHWLLSASFLGAMVIALAADDDGALFQMHMMLGLTAAFVVLLRVVWGVIGTRYARFGSFIFGPSALLRYLKSVFTRVGERHAGHNPGSAYAIYAMLILTIGLAVTGVLQQTREPLEELHEILAYLMLLTVAMHVTGLVLHTIRHRENIALSMLDGKKEADAQQAIASPGLLAGVLVLALCAGWAYFVLAGHDPGRRQLNLLGLTVPLGEEEDEDEDDGERDHDHEERHHRDRDDHHEDDDD
jgi:cytochrome b